MVIQAPLAADGCRRQQVPLPVKNGLVAWIPIVNLGSLAAEAALQVSQLQKNAQAVSMLTASVCPLVSGQ